jgi:hypothetical protein
MPGELWFTRRHSAVCAPISAPNNAYAARNRRQLSLQVNAVTGDFFWLAVKRLKRDVGKPKSQPNADRRSTVAKVPATTVKKAHVPAPREIRVVTQKLTFETQGLDSRQSAEGV